MKLVNARLVPKDLKLLQKRRRVEVATNMLDNVAEDRPETCDKCMEN